MRYRKAILITLLLLFPLLLFASAHSGGTDSKGGHWDHSSDTYHYHHGYSAHQHEDNGKTCPILYDEGYDKGYEENYQDYYNYAFSKYKKSGIYDAFIYLLPFPIILVCITIILTVFAIILRRKRRRWWLYD